MISAETAVALSRSTHTADDARFMQHMIVHHQQAVEMVALLDAHGSDPRVKLMGQRIALSQEAEIRLMQDWLLRRGWPLEMDGQAHAAPQGPGGGHGVDMQGHGTHTARSADASASDPEMASASHDHAAMGHALPGAGTDETPVMPGMLSPAQMRRLAAARGADFDQQFLRGMIQHHQGALDMVTELQRKPDSAEDAVLSDFITGVIADQSAEILRMQLLLSSLDNPSS